MFLAALKSFLIGVMIFLIISLYYNRDLTVNELQGYSYTRF